MKSQNPASQLEQAPDQFGRQLAARKRNEEALRDLAHVASSPEGQRVLLRILKMLELDSPASSDNIPLQNAARRLLRQLAAASPNTARWLLGELFAE